MYYEHFGLDGPPFKITPDTRLFYAGGKRGAILDAIAYAITSGEGIVKVVGEVGSGKTMLCRMLEVRLPERVEVVYLANPSLSPDNILHAIAFELKLPLGEDASRLKVMHALQRHLLDKHAQDRQVVIFVEEAQGMPLETLEEIRLLSNLETNENKLLQIVLFGQPELEPNLSTPRIRQLRERITHSFELPPFSTAETGEYLNFRLRSVGYRGPDLFDRRAVRAIARHAQGLIRRTNILADKSLLAAFAAGDHQVTPRHVRIAVRDSELWRHSGRRGWPAPLAAASAATLAALLVGGGWLLAQDPESRPRPRVPAAAPEGPAPAVPFAPVARPPEPDEHASLQASVDLSSTAALPPAAKTAPAPTRAAAPPPPPPVPATPAATVVEAVAGTPSGRGPATTTEAAPPALAAAGQEVAGAPPQDRADYLERRLRATEHWLRRVDRGHYSIQLMLVGATRGDELEESLVRGGLADALDRVYVYPTSLGGREAFGVLYDEFKNYSQARTVLAGLPPEARLSQPFIRRIRDIRWR